MSTPQSTSAVVGLKLVVRLYDRDRAGKKKCVRHESPIRTERYFMRTRPVREFEMHLDSYTPEYIILMSHD